MPGTIEPPKEQQISLKVAVQVAVDSFASFYPGLIANNLMLEEVEESEDGKFWTITLGFDDKRTLSAHDKMFKSEYFRAYKMFRIDSVTGKVVSMKIRTLD